MKKFEFELCVRNLSRTFSSTHLIVFLIDNHGKLLLYDVLWIFASNFVVGNFSQNLQKSLFSPSMIISPKNSFDLSIYMIICTHYFLR